MSPMSVPVIVGTRLAGTSPQPLLVVGPSLGTTVSALWLAAAERLSYTTHVVGWDLPGHGASPPPQEAFRIADLATGVVEMVDRQFGGGRFRYAGVSVGGAVGLALLLDHSPRVVAAALICTGARIGSAGDWRARAGAVREAGTAHLAEASVQRWFAPGFSNREPATAAALVRALDDADDCGYARTCEALAGFDVRNRLADIHAPVIAVAGACDVATPPASLRSISEGVARGRYVEVPDAAHLVPAERPELIANVLEELTEWSADDRQPL
jgi:3-oxoadipate enol-lactonase / 4-carboxymuconolactone decarboxylase